MFGDADSGATAETRNEISTTGHIFFTPLGTDTYKICVSFGEDKGIGA